MKASLLYRSLLAGMAATVLVGNVAAMAVPQDATGQTQDRQNDVAHQAADQMDNASTTAKVKAALMANDQTNAFNINVDTDGQGLVTLRGTTPSLQARQAAGEVARQVSGVASVNNQLTVSNDRTSNPQTLTAKAQAAGQSGWLTTKVKTALADDSQITASNVNVTTHRGRVVLTGMVPTEEDRQAAIQRAKSVEGVKKVDASSLRVDASASTQDSQQ